MKTYTHDVVQVVVFHRNPEIQFLVLERAQSHGGWWQPITGHIEADETALDALHRELREETGIIHPLSVSEQIYSYEYDTSEGPGRDVAYMTEVSPEDVVVLSDEHEEYVWLGRDDALQRLKYEGNKESLRRAYGIIAK